MKKNLFKICVLLVFLGTAGCGTFIYNFEIIKNNKEDEYGVSPQRVYGGIVCDARLVSEGVEEAELLTIFFLLDTPITAVVDTVLIPYYLITYSEKKEEPKPDSKEQPEPEEKSSANK